MRAIASILWGLIVALLAAQVAAQPTSASATLELIQKRQSVHIGVKTDFPPFGMLNSAGEPVGWEVDLAREIARSLGVRPVITSVTTENRFQKLEQGDIDIMIATAADTSDRRQVATAVEPSYYAGGVGILLRPGLHFSSWQALRGSSLCATQGAYFNRPMAQRYLLQLNLYRSVRDALMALRDGHCVGYLYSSAAIHDILGRAEWAGYTAPLPIALLAPWSIFIARREAGSEFDRRLGDIVADWHRSGFLLEREKAWNLQESKFLFEAHELWHARDSDGSLTCVRDIQGQWPVACRNRTFVRADEAAGVLALGLWIQEKTGLNLSFIYDSYDRSGFLGGIANTLALTAGSVALSLLLGALLGCIAESGPRWLTPPVNIFIVYARMTPPLLQMYLIYFGFGTWLWTQYSLHLPAMLVAIWCMGAYTGAAVMNTLIDTAEHRRSTDPAFRLRLGNVTQLVELSAPAIKSSLNNVLKQSVMASAIAVPEILSAATAIMSDQGNVTVMMNAFLVTFVGIIILWGVLFDVLERAALRRAARETGGS